MTESQWKRRVQLITVIAVCLLLTLLVALIGQIVTKAQLSATHKSLQNELAKLEQEADSISAEIELKTSDRYAEQYAREEWGLVKDGETKFVIDDGDEESDN